MFVPQSMIEDGVIRLEDVFGNIATLRRCFSELSDMSSIDMCNTLLDRIEELNEPPEYNTCIFGSIGGYEYMLHFMGSRIDIVFSTIYGRQISDKDACRKWAVSTSDVLY